MLFNSDYDYDPITTVVGGMDNTDRAIEEMEAIANLEAIAYIEGLLTEREVS